ncbi:spermatogenesis-associated protein 2-like protein [Discoglossus pictus]
MSVDALIEQYEAWLDTAYDSGLPAPCTDMRVTRLVRDRLLEEPELHGALHNDAFSLIASGLKGSQELQCALQRLSDAFQLLEQAAIHLYCEPWRKEFQTIKIYSGLYVHVLEAALPQDAIFRALQRLGYEPLDNGSSLCVVAHIPARSLCAAALGFFAARVECLILSNILSCSFPGVVTGTDLIRERRSCRGEAACMERLQKLTLGANSPPVTKNPAKVEVCEQEVVKDGADCPYQTQFCSKCHESRDRHVSGKCRVEVYEVTPLRGHENRPDPGGAMSHTTQHQVHFGFHDCVFLDQTVERSCVDCLLLHSLQCPKVVECKDSGHQISNPSLYDKQEALREETRNRYQTHSCLQPGHLPHYRCAICRQLHYIKCPGVIQCRELGHRVNMIMLERDQIQWLQLSKRDLTWLGLEISAQTGK